jgi:Lanthionine synthetase C-like protein
MLFEPSGHEPLTSRPWDDGLARAAIAAIVADAESAFDERELWLAHPFDLDGGPLTRVASLYLGASGVIWALHDLARAGVAGLRSDWAPVAVGLVEQYSTTPDFQDLVDGTVPSLWMGEAGILLVAHTLAPSAAQEDRLLDIVRANEANPTWELMWGSPGTMIAAQVMHEQTGADRWLDAWRASADRLWAEWRDDLWQQDLYGSQQQILGPAHGFAGNVLALAGGGLLDDARRAELGQRAVATLTKYARREDGLAQWPASLQPSRSPAIRTQWCHGAPGIVASLASVAPHDEQLTELLVAGGELTWQAGPLAKGANLCHGTAGNGYAFLKLFERTGDELWLERARGFAMHAIEQVERATAEHGRGRYSLWTGDVGTALYLQSCLAATAAFPTLDYF